MENVKEADIYHQKVAERDEIKEENQQNTMTSKKKNQSLIILTTV